MITKKITNLFFAVLLTLIITIGSEVVADHIGLLDVPSAYACTGSGSGGGC